MSTPALPTYGISYLRYSSRKQKKNTSYARQIEDTERYCKENGFTLVERLEDLGISAWDGSNLDDAAALGGFLQRLETGRVPKGTVLICENLDRLSRGNILDALQLFIGILKKGIDIVTTMDRMRYSEQSVRDNPTQLMISITILSRGSDESTSKSERVTKSVKIRRQRISNNEFARFHCPSWLTHYGEGGRELNAYKLIDANAEKVKLIFELYVAGHGVYSLIKELNKRGVKSFTKTGKWNAVFLHELLQNPAVIGTYALIDPPQKDYYPKAIPESLFYQALEKRRSNCNHRGKRGRKEINIFGGLVKCYKCHSSMIKSYSKNGKGVKYEGLVCCKTKLRECSYEYTNWKRFQESFKAVFVSEHFERFVEGMDSEPKTDRTAELQGKLVDINSNIQRVAGILARTDSTALESQLSALEIERKAFEGELANEIIRVKCQTSKTTEWAKYVKRLDTDFNNQEFRLSLRAFMQRTIGAIVCHPDKYHVYFKNSKDSVTVGMDKHGYQVLITKAFLPRPLHLQCIWQYRIANFD